MRDHVLMTDLQLVLIGVVATVLAGCLGAWATWKFGNRRGRMLFTWEVVSLLEQGGRPELLEVTYRHMPVPDPHLVKLQLVNIGPSEISSAMFDSGASIDVALADCVFYGSVRTSHPSSFLMPATGTKAPIVSFRPALLKKREALEVTLIVAGGPAVEIAKDPLVGVDIVERTRAEVLASGIAETAAAVLPFGLGSTIKVMHDSVVRR